MDYEEFKEEVVKRLSKFAGETNVQLMDNRLNLMLGGRIAISFKLNEAYKDFESGSVGLDEIVSAMCDTKVDPAEIAKVNTFADMLIDFDSSSSKLELKLQSKKPEFGLADEVVPGIWRSVCVVDGGFSTVVTDQILQNWNRNYEELIQIALQNTSECELFTMKQAITAEMDDLDSTDLDLADLDLADQMFILRTKGRYGASVLMNEDAMQATAERLGGDLIVLPSSIYEVIVLKAKKFGSDFSELTEMVKEVNTSLADERNVLAWQAYYYSKGKKELKPLGGTDKNGETFGRGDNCSCCTNCYTVRSGAEEENEVFYD
jgi:hypothetical protein